MTIRATILAGVLCLPLFAGTALAVETGKLSLADAAKLGDRDAVRSLLSSRAKEDVAGAEGTAYSALPAHRVVSRVHDVPVDSLEGLGAISDNQTQRLLAVVTG